MSTITQTVEHDERSEWPHESDGGEWWQESVVLSWWDRERGIGGFVRIGHEPNHAGGIAVVTGGVVTRDGTAYRRNAAASFADGDRLERGFGARGGTYRYVHDGRLRFEARDEGLDLDLEIEDFYARTDFFPKTAGSLVDEIASNHFETSGRITGTVTLDGRRYDVDGLCHRDHSWGLRRWHTILNHRWCPATFGPDLSLGSIVWHSADGNIGGFGYAVRDGVVTLTEDVDIAVVMEPDGMSFRAGVTTLTLPDGTRYVVEATPQTGLVSDHHGVAWIDAVGEAALDGRVGFCDLEVSTNPRAGTGPITALVRATNADGLVRP